MGGKGSGRQSVLVLTRIRSPTSLDIAWAAGIWEGEGSIIYNGSIQVSMSQSDEWLPQQFLELFGWRIYSIKSDYYWRNHPDSQPTKTQYRWILNGDKAIGFWMTIWKFLSPRRRKQIIIAMEKLNAK